MSTGRESEGCRLRGNSGKTSCTLFCQGGQTQRFVLYPMKIATVAPKSFHFNVFAYFREVDFFFLTFCYFFSVFQFRRNFLVSAHFFRRFVRVSFSSQLDPVSTRLMRYDLYKRVCPSVCPSVRMSVRPSVCPSVRDAFSKIVIYLLGMPQRNFSFSRSLLRNLTSHLRRGNGSLY